MKFAVRKRRAPSIIIVSLVDILTILLIFFVVSTTFKKDQPEVKINLPESKTSTAKPAEIEHAIVSVDAEDALKLDGKAIAVDELQEAIMNLPAGAQKHACLEGGRKSFVRNHHQSDGRAETRRRDEICRPSPKPPAK